MERWYKYVADGRTFWVAKRRLRDMVVSSTTNPWMWFSWEVVNNNRMWLCCGARTMQEAQQPIDNICLRHKEVEYQAGLEMRVNLGGNPAPKGDVCHA